MSTFEWLTVALAAFGLFVNVALLFVFFGQLRTAIHQVDVSLRANAEQNLRQGRAATIEFYRQTLERREALAQKLGGNSDEVVHGAIERALSGDGQLRISIRSYLTHWELLATAVNAEVLDYGTFERLSGSLVQRTWSRFLPYIKDARRRNSRAYCELESLAFRVRAQRVDIRESVVHSG